MGKTPVDWKSRGRFKEKISLDQALRINSDAWSGGNQHKEWPDAGGGCVCRTMRSLCR